MMRLAVNQNNFTTTETLFSMAWVCDGDGGGGGGPVKSSQVNVSLSLNRNNIIITSSGIKNRKGPGTLLLL